MKPFRRHMWTFSILPSGHDCWLVEWRSLTEWREWSANSARMPSEWNTSDGTACSLVGQSPHMVIHPRLAGEIIASWRTVRKAARSDTGR